MNQLRRVAPVAAATLLLACVTPMTASADVRPLTAAECQRGAAGFVDIPNDQSGRVVDRNSGRSPS